VYVVGVSVRWWPLLVCVGACWCFSYDWCCFGLLLCRVGLRLMCGWVVFFVLGWYFGGWFCILVVAMWLVGLVYGCNVMGD